VLSENDERSAGGDCWQRKMRRSRSVPRTAVLGLRRDKRDIGQAPGAVFEERGRSSIVLMGDLLTGSTHRMTDGRKKKKRFR
jgi:hypothetical protein